MSFGSAICSEAIPEKFKPSSILEKLVLSHPPPEVEDWGSAVEEAEPISCAKLEPPPPHSLLSSKLLNSLYSLLVLTHKDYPLKIVLASSYKAIRSYLVFSKKICCCYQFYHTRR